MHRDTNLPALPALTADLLRDNGLLVDNLSADLWKQVGMDALLKRAGFGKRSGTPVSRLAFSLVLCGSGWRRVPSPCLRGSPCMSFAMQRRMPCTA